MNDIDKMPVKCRDCAYWEIAKEPYVCTDCESRMERLSDLSKPMPTDDYIKRSDALEELQYIPVTMDDEIDVEAAQQLINAIPAADVEPKRKWIPVTERLPEKGQVVLAAGKRHATSGQFQGVSISPYYWWWKGHTLKEVHWWMPLPEPPKEEKESC